MSGVVSPSVCSNRLKADIEAINGGFTAQLRNKHNAVFTIHLYCRFLILAARFVSRRGKSLRELKRKDEAWVLRGCLRGWKADSCRSRRAALHAWLKFCGQFEPRVKDGPGQRFLNDYERFLQQHRGLAACTRGRYLQVAREYLLWQVQLTKTNWRRIKPQHIWRFAEQWTHGRKPKTIGDYLSALRQFLSFLHVRGAISLGLSKAVPSVANYGQGVRKETLSEAQRRQLLASFDCRSPEGRRDYTMALCMIDLGLRAIEICRLRLDDIDWSTQEINVPPAKAGSGRKLPIPAQVFRALRVYVRKRPTSDHDELFVGHKLLVGRPLVSHSVGSAMNRAYRRCGFPRSWCGSHRLRHTFATRLCAHGADLKQIADLLGHQLVSTTNRYAQVDLRALQALAQPWPK